MSSCDDFSVKALLYLEDRLQGQELDDFSAPTSKSVLNAARAWMQTERCQVCCIDRGRYIRLQPLFAPAWPRRLNSTPLRYVPAKISTNVSCVHWGAGSLTRLGGLQGSGC